MNSESFVILIFVKFGGESMSNVRCLECNRLAKLDKNGYCNKCAFHSLGHSSGNYVFDKIEKIALTFMPRWLFKILGYVVFGGVLYYLFVK